MRLGFAWTITCLLVLAAVGCSVHERTGLKIASATPQDAGTGKGCASSSECDEDAGPEADAAPVSCQDGECWWSRDQSGCRSAGLPGEADRPARSNQGDGTLPDIYLGVSSLRIGETDHSGVEDREAWQHFGFDLDGLCTATSGCDATRSACRPASVETPYDGELCRDNTFARLVPIAVAVPEIGTRFGISEHVFNCNLWRGTYTLVLKISGYNGERNDSRVRVDFYLSPGAQRLPDWTCPNPDYAAHYPKWRANSRWNIDPDNLTGPIEEEGKLPDSMVADAAAFVREHYLVARFPDELMLRLADDGLTFRGFALTASQNIWTGRLERDAANTWNIRDGIFAGRIGTANLIRSYRQIGLCRGAGLDGFFDGVVEWIEQSVDVRLDGAVDPDNPCDAISFGLGFEAGQLTPGAAEASTPLVECCAPGVAIEDCSAMCGDGRKNGDEQCDIAIASGQPGACPTACPAAQGCMQFQLTGEDCETECRAVEISAVGAPDSCCPRGVDATADPDCAAICGNEVIEPGETCDPPASCPVCSVPDSCLMVSATGSAAGCNISCTIATANACAEGDGCCPEGCDPDNDSDCSDTCGNGSLEGNETCDGDGDRACPATCDDGLACTTDYRSGSPNHCNVVCTHVPVTAAISGDGCCPSGASANSDSDCMAECGNGKAEPGEACDDGNRAPGDGCTPECKQESGVDQCLQQLDRGRAPECARCSCEQCKDLVLNCYLSESAQDNQLCRSLVECGLSRMCTSEACYCGSAPLTSCIFGTGNGPCKAEVEAAARTTVPGDIVTRSSDKNYPLGRANALAACARENCSAECEVP